MGIEELKNEISQKIDELNKFDLSKLYPTSSNVSLWNNVANSEAEKFVKKTLTTLRQLKKNLDLLDFTGISNIQNLNSYLSTLITQLQTLESTPEITITNQHHSPLESFHKLNNVLRTSSLYSELNIRPDLKSKLEDLAQVEPLLNKLKASQQSLANAIDTSNEWLKNKALIDQETIKGQAKAFLDRASEHRLVNKRFIGIPYAGNQWWLYGAFIFSIVVAYLTQDLIQAAGDNLDVGSAILRISSLIVPGYLRNL